tara:strand:- start:437 stop:811 length:375 start_codon:yes stop_codon:yes gene_type:complete
MALSIASGSSFSYKLAVESDLEADPKVNIFGAGAKVYAIDVNNAANSGTVVYLKLYDAASTVTAGTSKPDHQIRIAGGGRVIAYYPGGVVFQNGISMNCSTTSGTGGDATTDPAASVTVNLVVA